MWAFSKALEEPTGHPWKHRRVGGPSKQPGIDRVHGVRSPAGASAKGSDVVALGIFLIQNDSRKAQVEGPFRCLELRTTQVGPTTEHPARNPSLIPGIPRVRHVIHLSSSGRNTPQQSRSARTKETHLASSWSSSLRLSSSSFFRLALAAICSCSARCCSSAAALFCSLSSGSDSFRLCTPAPVRRWL